MFQAIAGLFRKKPDVFDAAFGSEAPRVYRELLPPAVVEEPTTVPMLSLDDLPDRQVRWTYDDGAKFPGGYGPIEILTLDYWALRARSAELFEKNLYARGLIRRLAVNVINTGLHLEAVPEESILGFKEDELADWSEDTENRFQLWADEPNICDQNELKTFGELQSDAYVEALVTGDVLCVLQQDRRTGLPRLRLIPGSRVQTPLEKTFVAPGENRVIHGVELDASGKQVAYWIAQFDPKTGLQMQAKRLPAYGEKSGRRLAWLCYATEKRHDQVRGKPILSLVLQSLKEIDRYRDAVQRKAALNAFIAMFIKRDVAAKAGTRMTAGGGAVRKTTETAQDSHGNERRYNVAELFPGLILDSLQPGEEPHGFLPQGTDEKFADFEAAIIYAVAWANNVPPEILTMTFRNNYSASQAAINEFKMFLDLARTQWGKCFCRPIYVEWLIASALSRKITARGLLDAFRDFSQHDTFTAWVSCDWSGHIKPAVDLSKLVGGYVILIEQGLMTRARACRELTGMRYSKVVKQLARENEQLAPVLKALAKAQPVNNTKPPAQGDTDQDDEDEEREAA